MSKEGVTLDYPMPVGDEKKAEYERNGILLKRRRDNGYTRIETPFELSIADFASLTPEALSDISPHLSGTKYEALVDMAARSQLLIRQATTIHEDGFPYPTKEKPFTWPLREKIPEEIENQMRILRKFGITEVKVGLEMEFSTNEKPVKGFYHARSVKRKVLRELRTEIDAAVESGERKRLKEKYFAVKKFNAREMLMYDLIELDPKTKNILEPLFGKTRDGNGYYDAQSILELKVKPLSPEMSLKSRQVVLNSLYDKAVKYGLELTSHPSFHINVSFWNKNGNILNDKNPAFSSKAKLITQGITKAFYDAMFVLINKYHVQSEKLIKFALEVNRQNLLRYSTDRIEVRPSVHESMQDADVILAILLSGAIYGLEKPDAKGVVPATKVKSPVVHHTKDRSKVTSHVLNNATISRNGMLNVSSEYIREHDDILNYELGITKKPPEASMFYAVFRMFSRSDYLPFVQNFFNSTRVVRSEGGGLSLKFPETSKGKYEFTVPAINMDKIPLAMRLRLLHGMKVEREEYTPYIRPGERIPMPERKVVIDVGRLEKTLELKTIKTKFVVKEYDFNKIRIREKPRNWTKAAWARYRRLLYSRPLSKGLTRGFREKLGKLAKDFSKTELSKRVITFSPEAVQNKLFFKVNDKDYVYKNTSVFWSKHWKERGLVEGRDFFKRSVKIKFSDVGDPKAFEYGLRRVFKRINRNRGANRYKFILDKHEYSGGRYDMALEVEPALLKALKTIAK
ncbi:MAG: hypothetical protein HYV90_04935 [Candidatus Woesebacteria bacterium]|nr:MAG: hypothetical protein HYV90_04935 [Candidatus Woesebacteria bacterium]